MGGTLLLAAGTDDVFAAGAPTCTITQPTANPITVTQGGTVTYIGQASGGTPPYSVTWTFGGGTPASATGTIQASGGTNTQGPITYNTVGSFTTSFTATDSNAKQKTCTAATRTVNVQAAGGNSPPSAANDSYSTHRERR